MIQGLAFHKPEDASRLCKQMFERGVIMETSGPRDEVAKLMPPLTIEDSVLKKGLQQLEAALADLYEGTKPKAALQAKG